VNSDPGILVLRTYATLPHSTFNDFSGGLQTSRGMPSPHISSSFSVTSPCRNPFVCRPHAPSVTFSSPSCATLPPHQQCSGGFWTSSRSRLCPGPRRVLTWTYVACPWRLSTRSFRRRVTPYLSDRKLSSDVLDPRLPTPLRISFRLSPGHLADVRRRLGTCGRRAIPCRSRSRSNV